MAVDHKADGDDLMRRASTAFARAKLQQAYDYYGMAAESYARSSDAPRDRMALAYYTRALLAVKGDATGDVASDLEQGDLCVAHDFPQAARFRGLLGFARATWRRMYDEFDEAHDLLEAARRDLVDAGRPLDLFELEREQARLDADRGRRDEAVAAARRAEEHAATPAHLVVARTLLADLHESWGDVEECRSALDAAASVAFEHKLKPQLADLRARLRYYEKRDA